MLRGCNASVLLLRFSLKSLDFTVSKVQMGTFVLPTHTDFHHLFSCLVWLRRGRRAVNTTLHILFCCVRSIKRIAPCRYCMQSKRNGSTQTDESKQQLFMMFSSMSHREWVSEQYLATPISHSPPHCLAQTMRLTAGVGRMHLCYPPRPWDLHYVYQRRGLRSTCAHARQKIKSNDVWEDWQSETGFSFHRTCSSSSIKHKH